MLSLHHELLTQMYVRERLDEATREHLLQSVERTYRGQRVPLRARMGRTLVRVGNRLEAATTI